MTNEELDLDWNDEIYDDVGSPDFQSVVVYSRDWTVGTILSQIEEGNIDLNPNFQRRNAWNDEKRSRLIESLIIGVPVPEIVLAEDKVKRRSYIVIDGKQRLLTIMGFANPEIEYWSKPRLKQLNACKDLESLTFDDLKCNSDYYRELVNSDVRCTVISNYESEDVLYDIFYRLNTGSVPLSTQELRQVLNKGDFADALLQHTNEIRAIHNILNLKEPDSRLRDAEIILRLLSIELYGDRYSGNLKRFLDNSMSLLSTKWANNPEEVREKLQQIDSALERAIVTLGVKKVGRKFRNGSWEGRFNRSLFEAQAYYFKYVEDEMIDEKAQEYFQAEFVELCSSNPLFLSSIESTTKTNESYEIRFSAIQGIFNNGFGLQLDDVPVKVS